ncbi:hypothetical protein I79_006598 [Cricetulus griseus]|uniref:Uncharacterized protein n=1 Tax=Cricetulus griseus TaxID=10029 RepID=G3H898_CRIGR|nr:hypothetical protein I79_006598 [Cricetulus griseus]
MKRGTPLAASSSAGHNVPESSLTSCRSRFIFGSPSALLVNATHSPNPLKSRAVQSPSSMSAPSPTPIIL